MGCARAHAFRLSRRGQCPASVRSSYDRQPWVGLRRMCIPLSAEKTCRTRALAIGCLGTAVLAAYLLRLCAMFPVAVCCSLDAGQGRQTAQLRIEPPREAALQAVTPQVLLGVRSAAPAACIAPLGGASPRTDQPILDTQ